MSLLIEQTERDVHGCVIISSKVLADYFGISHQFILEIVSNLSFALEETYCEHDFYPEIRADGAKTCAESEKLIQEGTFFYLFSKSELLFVLSGFVSDEAKRKRAALFSEIDKKQRQMNQRAVEQSAGDDFDDVPF